MAVNINSFLLSIIPFLKCFKVKFALIHVMEGGEKSQNMPLQNG